MTHEQAKQVDAARAAVRELREKLKALGCQGVSTSFDEQEGLGVEIEFFARCRVPDLRG